MDSAVASLRPDLSKDALQVVINGKLLEQRKHEGLFYSTIVSPAPDQYSSPMPFEVRSYRSLGERDSVVSVPCKIGGFYRRSYDTKPDERTGETRRVRPVVMTLEALDS